MLEEMRFIRPSNAATSVLQTVCHYVPRTNKRTYSPHVLLHRMRQTLASPCIADSSFPKIDSLEFEPWSFDYMSWPERICVKIVLTVWMEKAFLVAVQDSWQPRRISQSEDAPVWVLSWRTDDGDRFWQHYLIARACVQISRGQETRLRGMRMYPSADKEIVSITEIEQFVVALFRSVTGVTSTCLVRDYQVADEQSV